MSRGSSDTWLGIRDFLAGGRFPHHFTRLRGSATRFLSLLISGVVSSLFLVLLASQRISWVEESTVVFLLAFLQWYALGMTIAKVGIDQVAFAVQSRDASVRFDITRFCVRRVAPLAAITCVVIGILFSPVVAAVAFVVTVLDAYSLAATAELNARKVFIPAIVGNLLNYPLFLTVGIVGSVFLDSRTVFLAAFIGSTLVRAYWVRTQHKRLNAVRIVDYTAVTEMMFQQVLNFFLFRIDQLLLPLLLIVGLISNERSAQLVYLFKYPELVSSAVVIVGLFVFPLFLPDARWVEKRFRFDMRWKYMVMTAVGTIAVAVGFALYAYLWGRPGESVLVYGIFYLINAFLVFPVNALIYLHLGQGHAFDLIRNSFLSILVGLGTVLTLFFFDRLDLIGLVVPCQLLVIIALTFIIPVRESRPLYSAE